MKIRTLAQLVGVVVIGYGWYINLMVVYYSNFDALNGELVLRCIGVVLVPLGAILGLFF